MTTTCPEQTHQHEKKIYNDGKVFCTPHSPDLNGQKWTHICPIVRRVHVQGLSNLRGPKVRVEREKRKGENPLRITNHVEAICQRHHLSYLSKGITLLGTSEDEKYYKSTFSQHVSLFK